MRRFLACLATSMLLATASAAPPDEPVPLSMASSNPDKDWMPAAEQVQQAIEQSRHYFAARDAGRFDEAYRLYAPTQKARVAYGGWRKAVEGLNTTSGGITARKLLRITWYKDPPQGRPGVYAAVDFSATSPNLALHCGYIVWREQDDGTLGIVREEENVLDKPSLAKIPAARLPELRKAMHC